jgi:hypothetical protein
MSYEEEKAEKEASLAAINKAVEGKRIKEIRGTVGYPAWYGNLDIVLEDGTVIHLAEGSMSCPECDPEGMGNPLHVDVHQPGQASIHI